MLRRTKTTRGVDGEPILKLPPKTTTTIALALSGPERVFYDALLAKSR